jgi:hypothetical protein
MGDFFLLQMDDSFTEGVYFDTSKEGKGERQPHAPHSLRRAKREGPEPSRLRKLRPYERSRWTAWKLAQRSPQTSCAARRTRAWLHDQSLQALGID